MKKLFSLLTAIVLCSGMTWAAQIRHDGTTYCKALRTNNSGQYNIMLRRGAETVDLFLSSISIGENYKLNGLFKVNTNNSSYLYTTGGTKLGGSSLYGAISFSYTGRSNDDGDPIYRVKCTLDRSGTGYYFDEEIPVQGWLNNSPQTRMTLTDAKVTEIPVLNYSTWNTYSDYWWLAGYDETDRGWSFQPNSVSSIDQIFVPNSNKYGNGCYYMVNDAKTYASTACAFMRNVSGYYFFDGFYTFSGTQYHVTMYNVNFQAQDNDLEETFEWEDVTLAKRADYSNSGVVVLTATNSNNKKVVLQFVVDKSEVGDDVIIPAGIYNINDNGTAGSVIAFKGMDENLDVKGSYACPTGAITLGTTNLWCLRTGTVVVGTGMSSIHVNSPALKGSEVDIQINGPVIDAPQYIITVQAANDDYCTVSGGDTYYEGDPATLRAFSKSEHLYIFDKWQIKNVNDTYDDVAEADGGKINPLDITVTADATYRAVYRLAKRGTITVTADHGTFSGTGNYTGGEEITLEITADEGYIFSGWDDDNDGVVDNTDNPRTVYVDGDKDYTALFVEGVEIYVANGTYNVQGNYFDISGSVNNYQVQFESYGVSTLQTGDYPSSSIYKADTYVQYNGGDRITFTNRQATISRVGIMTWRLDALFSNSTGPAYHVVIDVQKPLNGDTYNNISHTFTEDINVHVDSNDDNIWRITTSRNWETEGWEGWWSDFAVYIDKTKQCGASGIPSGVYTVAYPASAGNVVPTIGYSTSSNSSNPTYDGTICGYYNNGYHNWFFPVSGTIEIVNNNGSYYFRASLTNSRGYTLTETYGSKPGYNTVTISSNNDSYGSVQIATCGAGAVAGETNKYYTNTILTLTAVPSSSSYSFDHWELDGEEVVGEDETYNYTVTSNATIQAMFSSNVTTHTITLSNGTNGTITVHNEDTDADVVFTDNTATVTEGTTLTITATGNTYEYGLFTLKVNGNAFASGNTLNLTEDITIAATYGVILWDNRDNDYYDDFKTRHGNTENAIYNRQFVQGRWSTMCLPFSLDLATMIANKMYGCVYEFKYATGNANVGSGVNLYFSNAKSIEAGKCYIVNANSALETKSKTPFVFSGVTIDLTNDKVATLTSVGDYNKLPGYKSEGTTIELVGTLRNGTLQGSATGNTYMGLKENKIYYPNTGTGSTIWAYRGIFRSTSALNVEKMRIVVDGEDRGEIIIDADGDILAPSDAQSRKFIENGVLYIEREGVIYDAQGKRVEN